MSNKPRKRPRWVRSKDTHTPGFFLVQDRKQIGRILWSDWTRTYSCFVGEPSKERWLGCAAETPAAKKTVEDAVKADAKRKEPAVWTFYSTGEAYGACQCNEEIRDGDVLVIEREKVIGLAGTWPFALTEAHGELHTHKPDVRTYKDGMYLPSIPVAEREAARIGIPLTRLDAAATPSSNNNKEG